MRAIGAALLVGAAVGLVLSVVPATLVVGLLVAGGAAYVVFDSLKGDER